jgi:hypothetical protein
MVKFIKVVKMEILRNKLYKTFQEFFDDVLSPSGGMYNEIGNFIYRGESSNTYKLIPSILRKDNLAAIRNLGTLKDKNDIDFEIYQIPYEQSLIRQFYERANKHGLKVFNIDNNPLDKIEPIVYTDQFSGQWILPKYIEIAALAQHYGIPTRLLDWTSDIFVTLYFSAIGALKKINSKCFSEDEKFAIWALNVPYIQSLEYGEPTPLKILVPKYSDNPNLNAQKGVLSYWEIIYNVSTPVDRTPLDELLVKQLSSQENPVETTLFKFEIPILEAIIAFKYILDIGYTAGRLFPGYAGIVKEMEEEQLVRSV